MKSIAALLIAVALIAGCAEPIVQQTDHYNVSSNVMTKDGQPVPPTGNPPGADAPAWVKATVEATGEGAPPQQYANEPGRARIMAKQAALRDAQRKLLEQVLGVQLDSRTRVHDAVVNTDEINAGSSGLIRSFETVGENYNKEDGTYSIRVKLNLYNVWQYMRERKIYYK